MEAPARFGLPGHCAGKWVRAAEWIQRHAALAAGPMRRFGLDPHALSSLACDRAARAATIRDLPLAGCSFDFKASNLFFSPAPILIDPDHAARMPRLFDLAIAAMLFHSAHPTAPGRLWSTDEWWQFLDGYGQHVALTCRTRRRRPCYPGRQS